MPGMDGFQTTHELRDRGFKKPIIALTAHANEDRLRTMSTGFSDHVSKPIDRDRLIEAINQNFLNA